MTERLLAEELAEIHGSFALSEASEVTARVVGKKFFMKSPYNKEVVPKLGRNGLGGKWKKTTKEWEFTLNLLPEVKKLYSQAYGSHGFNPNTKAQLKLDVDDYLMDKLPLDDLFDRGSNSVSVWAFGYKLATLDIGTDGAQPQAFDGVSVIKGGFRVETIDDVKMIRFEQGTHLIVDDLNLNAVATEAASHMIAIGHNDIGVEIFGEDEGGTFDQAAAAQAAAAASAGATAQPKPKAAKTGFDMDTLDGTAKGRAKEMDDMLGAAAFRMLNSGIPQAMIDRLLEANGLARK